MTVSDDKLIGRHIDVTYDVDEDRLHLVVRNDMAGMGFHLTRRLCRALLVGLIDLLAKTSGTASRVSMDARSDVLLFEHVGALSRRGTPTPASKPGSGSETASPPASPGIVLLRQIDLSMTGGTLSLSMTSDGRCLATMPMSRDNVHQLIGMLYDRSRLAKWDFAELAWLDRRSQFVIPETATVS